MGRDARQEIASLIHTALYDRRGELVEGGFVDRWEQFSWQALDELERFFRDRGFRPEDAAQIREAVRNSDDSADAALLLRWLVPHTTPLIRELLADDDPRLRAEAAKAAAAKLDPTEWLHTLQDPDPRVREAAVLALAENRGRVPRSNLLLAESLGDSDPRVRLAAAGAVGIYQNPAGAEALLGRLQVETDADVRMRIIRSLAETAAQADILAKPDRLEKGIGAPVKAFLLGELNSRDAEVRRLVVSALLRLRGREAARALLERLKVEEDDEIRSQIAGYKGYADLGEEALEVLVSRMRSDASQNVRIRIALELHAFGEPAFGPTMDALETGADRLAAVIALGEMSDQRALPRLVQELRNPESAAWHDRLRTAIQDITRNSSYSQPRPAPPESAARIHQLIDRLGPESPFCFEPAFCRRINALPIHYRALYLWTLRPDGEFLCTDWDLFRLPTESVTDPLERFSLSIRAAQLYPELRELVPPPPPHTFFCTSCDGTGQDPDSDFSCAACDGLGWLQRKPHPG